MAHRWDGSLPITPGKIFLDGVSSAGKTSTTQAMRQIRDEPYPHAVLDAFFDRGPSPLWRAKSRGQPLKRQRKCLQDFVGLSRRGWRWGYAWQKLTTAEHTPVSKTSTGATGYRGSGPHSFSWSVMVKCCSFTRKEGLVRQNYRTRRAPHRWRVGLTRCYT
jgi:Chloramphenicol phosphotransferase-like protein